MNTTTTAYAHPIAPRFNIYTAIHKALRSQMGDALFRLGRIDVDDAADCAATLAQVDDLLDTCLSHLRHENDYLHSAIHARAPKACAQTASDHLEHVEEIGLLKEKLARVAAADARSKAALAHDLYSELALFVADNFRHMHVEETVNTQLLWAHYTDAELLDIHDRLLGSLTPQEHLTAARWMVPACTPFERLCMFKDMKEKTPPEALLGLLQYVKPHLDVEGWIKLSRSIGVSMVPGLAGAC